jgi:hypothetical protein
MTVRLEGVYRLRNGYTARVAPAADHSTTGRHEGTILSIPGIAELTRKIDIEWSGRGIAQNPTNEPYDVIEAVRSGEGL